MKNHVLLCTFFAILKVALCGNILYLNGIPSPSHHIYNRVLVLGLAAKGHNVTFVSVDTVEKVTPNVHYIHLEKVYEIYFGGADSFNVLEFAGQTEFESIVEMSDVFTVVCEGILASKGLDVILNYPKTFKFDAVIYDFTFGPCLLPLVAKFNNPPLISISAFANPPYSTDIVGGQKQPAYIPHYAVKYSTEMTFVQRFFNTYLYLVDWL
jgi:glucuronosyltransferase